MNNDNDLNLHSMTKLSGWLGYCIRYANNTTCDITPLSPHSGEIAYFVPCIATETTFGIQMFLLRQIIAKVFH